MKLLSIISTIALLTPVLGCVHASGEIYQNSDAISAVYAEVWDNGAHVCSSPDGKGWRTDQDGHLSVNCVSGYVYALNQEAYGGNYGTEAWYGYGSNGWTFTQPVKVDIRTCPYYFYDYNCYHYQWDVYEFC